MIDDSNVNASEETGKQSNLVSEIQNWTELRVACAVTGARGKPTIQPRFILIRWNQSRKFEIPIF